MTQFGPGNKRPTIRRGGIIRADWLNQLAADVDANARRLDQITTEVPEGEDGDGTEPPITLTEEPGTAVWGAVQRIEDANDPNVFINVRNKIRVTMRDQATNTLWELNFEDTPQP